VAPSSSSKDSSSEEMVIDVNVTPQSPAVQSAAPDGSPGGTPSGQNFEERNQRALLVRNLPHDADNFSVINFGILKKN